MSKTRYPKIFNQSVDLTKINLPVIKRWIDESVDQQLPEDDVVADYIYELLIAEDSPNPKDLLTHAQEYLEEDGMKFTAKLWKLLLSAQADKDGIPSELIDKQKQMLEKMNHDKMNHDKEMQEKINKDRTSYRSGRDRKFERQPYERLAFRDRDYRHRVRHWDRTERDRDNRDNRDNKRLERAEKDSQSTEPSHKSQTKQRDVDITRF